MAERLRHGPVGGGLGQDAVLTVTVTYSLLNTDVTQVQTFVYGARIMIYSCCNENRKSAVLGNPRIASTASITWKCWITTHRARRPAQQTLLVHCLKAGARRL